MAQSKPYTLIGNASVPLRPKSPKGNARHDRRSSPGISDYRLMIAWSWFLATIPITATNLVFLVMVFHWRVSYEDSPFPKLAVTSVQDQQGAYLVNLSSSVILFVTSWASTLAPMLSGFLLTLASFPIARQLFRSVQSGRFKSLPTPYQLSLTLNFLNGSALGAIWSWIVYLITWRRKRQPHTPPLVNSLMVALLATLLGLLVTLADSWLHLTANTVSFVRVSPTTQPTNYSFGLTPACLTSNNSVAGQQASGVCSVSIAVTGSFFANASTSLEVLNDISSFATSYYTSHGGTTYAYLGIPGSAAPPNRDYSVMAYGATTQCELISQKCSLEAVNPALKYNCSNGFNGDILNSDLQAAFFTDASMSTNIRFNGSNEYSAGNPYYYAIAGITSSSGTTVQGSPEFVQDLHGPYGYVLGCNTTIYDINYDHVNGSISGFAPTVSNISVSNIWQTSISQTSDWLPTIQQAVGAAVFSTTGREFADKVALAFSKVTLALGAGSLEARPSLASQDRQTSLVARIPVAPLWTFVAVSVLYVLCGMIFAVLALVAARHEVPDIQARLTIPGLVADRFEDPKLGLEAESVEDLFEERTGHPSRRVAFDLTSDDGVYRYTAWRPSARSTSVL